MRRNKGVKGKQFDSLDRVCTPEEAKELFEMLNQAEAGNTDMPEYVPSPVLIKAEWLRAYMVREFHRDCHERMRQDIFCRVVRKIYGLSQKEFAKSIRFPTRFIADIERGDYPDDIDIMCRFEDAVAGFFLLRNSNFYYDCSDDGFNEAAPEFIEEVKSLWEALNVEREKIYSEELKKLPTNLQEIIKNSGKKYLG